MEMALWLQKSVNSLNTFVTVPYGSPTEFIIVIGSGGGTGSDGGRGVRFSLKNRL